MTDMALTWHDAEGRGDLALDVDDFAGENGLRTAVLLSLFTDRRAAPDDPLLPGDDPRGWWGDAIDDAALGSRLWLLVPAKRTPDVLRRAREYASEALAWLVEDGIAANVDVAASWGRRGLLRLRIQIARGAEPDDLLFEASIELRLGAG